MIAERVTDFRAIPEFAQLVSNADHVDVKTVEGDVTMREFIAAMIGYQPAWVTFLYGVRFFFVRLLGMKQEGIPIAHRMRPEDVPMTPGEAAAFFKVDFAEEDRYWAVSISESHLKATLGVFVEPLAAAHIRFHVITIVHYNSWAGPVYFNVIRPFHHVVVGRMAKAGVAPV